MSITKINTYILTTLMKENIEIHANVINNKFPSVQNSDHLHPRSLTKIENVG